MFTGIGILWKPLKMLKMYGTWRKQPVATGIIPPTLGLVNPDVQCDLNHVAGKAQTKQVHYAMTNAFGFGGQNSSLVLGEYKG